MRIHGTGIDLIEVGEFGALLKRGGDDFERRCFSVVELEGAGTGRLRSARLACCFAAKEAVLKALGTGWARGIAWNEVVIGDASSPAPTVTLGGAALRIAREMEVTSWLLSVSLTGGTAVATAVACTTHEPSCP